MRRKIRYILSALIIGAVSMILCGAGPLDKVTLDPRNVYKNLTADEILTALDKNQDKAKNEYNNQFAAVTGTIAEIDTINYALQLKGEGKSTLEVTTVLDAGQLKKGDKVKIYGRLYSHILGVSLQADKIVESSEKSSGAYETGDGKKYISAMTAERSIGKGHMKYGMPSEWADVEKKLDNVDGYQYKLNEIASDYKIEPEQLYVFYFSNEKYLLSLNDKNNTRGIEKAIINNILPGEISKGLLFDKEEITNFKPDIKAHGNTYEYYLTSFEDSSKKVHHVEFVFIPNGEDGIACLLYIFKESNHKNDIIYMMSTINTER